MIAAVRAAVDVPVIASGGAGAVEHFAPAVRGGRGRRARGQRLPLRDAADRPGQGRAAGGRRGGPVTSCEVERARWRATSIGLDPAIAGAALKRTPDGLVCAVVQQAGTREVLMVAWMDDEALHRTLTTGRATYWSRSRQDVLGQGRHVRARAARARGPAGLRRRRAAGGRRPDRRGLPHRRPHLLRRGRAARRAERRRRRGATPLGLIRRGSVERAREVALQGRGDGGDDRRVVGRRERLEPQHVAHHAQADELAAAPGRRAGRAGPAPPAPRSGARARRVMNWRISRAAASWLAMLRMSAASGPPPVWSQMVRNGSTMRSPSRSGSPGSSSAMSVVRVDRQVQRRGEQRLLAAEPVVDHRRVDAGAVGDRPDRRAVEPALGELGPGGGEQGGTGVRPAGPAAPPTSAQRGSGVARARPAGCRLRSPVIFPGRRIDRGEVTRRPRDSRGATLASDHRGDRRGRRPAAARTALRRLSQADRLRRWTS